MTTIPAFSQSSKRPASRIAVVGGGAAGFFAAVNIAEKNPQSRIVIFEAGQKPLQKVRISGGGRCNVTHACFDPMRLTEFYPRGQKELRSLFARFQPRDTMQWFESRGLRLKTEADGRVFPVSDCSHDVIHVLLQQAQRYQIDIRTGCRVESIQKDGKLFIVTSPGKTEAFDLCILSTGYSPPGWKLAESLGHQILQPVPSLFPFTVKTPILKDLQGIALVYAQGKLVTAGAKKPIKHEAEGALLITHTGLSGPLIYRLSAWGARELAESNYQAQLQLDLLPHETDETLRARLSQLFHVDDAKKKLSNTGLEPIPHRLWLALLEGSGLSLEQRGETVNKKNIHILIDMLKRLHLPITGKSPSKEEFVSCGGVLLKEVDFKTLESRRMNNLYFGGEILNIDGLTGGFNFQSCWSQGWVIAEAVTQRLS